MNSLPDSITPTRIEEALAAACGVEAASFRGIAWRNRRESAERSGAGQPFDLAAEEFGAALTEEAQKVIPKGEGPCFSMGASTGGGSTDEECDKRYGLTLDLDHRPVRSDGTVGWEAISAALQRAGIAHVIQVRAGKFHVHVPYGEPWDLTHGDGDLRSLKAEYRRLVGFMISLFERLGGVELDEHEAARLLGLVYVYTKRSEDEEVTTIAINGAGLDLGALLLQFRAELEALAASPTETPADSATDSTSADEDFYNRTQDVVRQKMLNNKKEARRHALRAIWRGKPFAQPGNRDTMLQKVASWLAFYCPEGDPEAITDILAPSLEAMKAEAPDDFLTWDQAYDKVLRAQADAIAKADAQAKADARIRAAIDAAARPTAEALADAPSCAEPPVAPPSDEDAEDEDDGEDYSGSLPNVVMDAEEGRVADEVIALGIVPHDVFYSRSRRLVEIATDPPPLRGINRPKGTPYIAAVTHSRMRDAISRWVKLTPRKDNPLDPVPRLHPAGWLVNGILDKGDWKGVRQLEAIVTYPVLRADGSVLTEKGYDASTGLFYQPGDLRVALPEVISLEDVRKARELLEEVVADFPFRLPEHRAAWVAALLTPFARFAFTDPSPLFLIDANVRGAGKSFLVDLISLILTGRPAARMTYTEDDDEMRKRITSIAIEALPLVMLDNVDTLVSSGSLAAALAATEWRDRRLGANETVSAPLYAVWFMTGNNATLNSDIARRTLHIRLDHPLEKPEQRDDFRHPDLVPWVLSRRAEIVAAALAILRGYCDAGRPSMKLPRWGTFQPWSDLLRDAVVWAGLADPGETRQFLAERTDVERGGLASLFDGLAKLDPSGTGKTTKQLIDAGTLPKHMALGEALADVYGGRGPITPNGLSRKLGKFVDRVVGDLVLRSKEVNNQTTWFVEPKPVGTISTALATSHDARLAVN